MSPLRFSVFLMVIAATSAATSATLVTRVPASGSHERVLYSFPGGPGGSGPAGLLAGAGGVLFGVTSSGGVNPCNGLPSGCGTVFQLTPSASGYTETVLYAFAGNADGNVPTAALVSDASGALYGITSFGGSFATCHDIPDGAGCGTVFKLTPTASGYSESVLHRFTGGTDGAHPLGTLLIDHTGALYGTTWLGGNESCKRFGLTGCGTVFKLTPDGSSYDKTTIYAFAGGANDGSNPAAGLLQGADGALYGATEYGAGHGAVYKLTADASGYAESLVFRFTKKIQGAYPASSLSQDSSGALYGTTVGGPKEPGCSVGSKETSCGVAYKLTPSGSSYTESVIHAFEGGNDGFAPSSGLTIGQGGRLYGVTFGGGGGEFGGAGTAYELSPSGSGYAETILARFVDNFKRNPGAFPGGDVLLDAKNDVHATAGGGHHCILGGGCGVVFELRHTTGERR